MTWPRVRALKVLEEMLDAGLEVEADRPHLRVRPASRLTDDLKRRVREVKSELLDALDPPKPEGPCPDCGSINYVRRPAGHWRCLDCWPLTANEAANFFFGPLCWHREEVPA